MSVVLATGAASLVPGISACEQSRNIYVTAGRYMSRHDSRRLAGY